jgi:hypothetical protein
VRRGHRAGEVAERKMSDPGFGLDIPRPQEAKRPDQNSPPGDQFVVDEFSLQADVKESDEAVGQLSEGLTVGLATCAELIVVAAGSRDVVRAQKAHWSHAWLRSRG